MNRESNPTACCNHHCTLRFGCYRAWLHDVGAVVSFHFDVSMQQAQGFACWWPVERRETA